jgi:hypothetical protein
MTDMDGGGSARLLAEMARPFVGDCPDLERHKAMTAALEEGIAKDPGKFDKGVLFVGAFELPVVPDASTVAALFDKVTLINLPSGYEATDMKAGTVSHSLGTNANGFFLAQALGIERSLVSYSLLTMTAARQLDYLRESGFVGKGWKVVVEIHYYRKRQGVGRDKFHKDTQVGDVLFVNLNYDTDVAMPGPEYILNPTVVPEHEKHIKETLPEKFLDDLRWVRSRLGRPTEISMTSIKPYQFVGFVDEAIHHMSPQFGGRTVKGHELVKFLTTTYGQDVVQAAIAARKAFIEVPLGAGGYFLSMVGDAPFSSYLTAVPAQDADMWFNVMGLAETSTADFDRLGLLDAGMGNDLIDKLFETTWEGYQNVRIPKAPEVVLADGPLKRQASTDALTKRVPPQVGDRRFFRTLTRIVKA